MREDPADDGLGARSHVETEAPHVAEMVAPSGIRRHVEPSLMARQGAPESPLLQAMTDPAPYVEALGMSATAVG